MRNLNVINQFIHPCLNLIEDQPAFNNAQNMVPIRALITFVFLPSPTVETLTTLNSFEKELTTPNGTPHQDEAHTHISFANVQYKNK